MDVNKTNLNKCVDVCVKQIESSCKIIANEKAKLECNGLISQWKEHKMKLTCEDAGTVLWKAFTCGYYTKYINRPGCSGSGCV